MYAYVESPLFHNFRPFVLRHIKACILARVPRRGPGRWEGIGWWQECARGRGGLLAEQDRLHPTHAASPLCDRVFPAVRRHHKFSRPGGTFLTLTDRCNLASKGTRVSEKLYPIFHFKTTIGLVICPKNAISKIAS